MNSVLQFIAVWMITVLIGLGMGIVVSCTAGVYIAWGDSFYHDSFLKEWLAFLQWALMFFGLIGAIAGLFAASETRPVSSRDSKPGVSVSPP